MTILTESVRAGEFIIAEGNGSISRDEVIISSAASALVAGTIMAAVNATGTATVSAQAGNVGDATLPTVTVAASAKPGRHTLTIVAEAGNAGTFRVEDPDGILVGTGTVAVAFAEGGLSFTLADGANDWDNNDRLFIDVAFAATEYVAYTAGAIAAGILYAPVADSAADQPGVIIARHAEVDSTLLTGLDASASAALAARQIIIR